MDYQNTNQLFVQQEQQDYFVQQAGCQSCNKFDCSIKYSTDIELTARSSKLGIIHSMGATKGIEKGEGLTNKIIAENWGRDNAVLGREFLHHWYV